LLRCWCFLTLLRSHWCLIIIANAGRIKEIHDQRMEIDIQYKPAIFYLDSMIGSGSSYSTTLRRYNAMCIITNAECIRYLNEAWKNFRQDDSMPFTEETIPLIEPQVCPMIVRCYYLWPRLHHSQMGVIVVCSSYIISSCFVGILIAGYDRILLFVLFIVKFPADPWDKAEPVESKREEIRKLIRNLQRRQIGMPSESTPNNPEEEQDSHDIFEFSPEVAYQPTTTTIRHIPITSIDENEESELIQVVANASAKARRIPISSPPQSPQPTELSVRFPASAATRLDPAACPLRLELSSDDEDSLEDD